MPILLSLLLATLGSGSTPPSDESPARLFRYPASNHAFSQSADVEFWRRGEGIVFAGILESRVKITLSGPDQLRVAHSLKRRSEQELLGVGEPGLMPKADELELTWIVGLGGHREHTTNTGPETHVGQAARLYSHAGRLPTLPEAAIAVGETLGFSEDDADEETPYSLAQWTWRYVADEKHGSLDVARLEWHREESSLSLKGSATDSAGAGSLLIDLDTGWPVEHRWWYVTTDCAAEWNDCGTAEIFVSQRYEDRGAR